MAYDDVLKHVGEFGRYQKRVYLLLCLPAISCALHKLAGVFLQAKSDHRCQLPFELANASYALPAALANASFPWDAAAGALSSCYRLDALATPSGGEPTNQSVPCDSWIYDKSKYSASATIEFDLVCSNSWLRAAADSSFMFGVLLGSIGFGALSDRFGRRPIFFITLVLQVVGGLLAAVAPEYYSFMVARVLIGATTSGVFLVAYVIAMEMVGPSKRLFAGVVCQMFFTLGFMLTALFAFLIPDWRKLQIALTVPGIVFLSYWWFIPESARWLLAKGRPEEAKRLLTTVAKENRVELPRELLDSLLASNDEGTASKQQDKGTCFDLLRFPNLRAKSLNIFFCWFVNSMTYYGLSWNTSNLGGNDYLNFLVSGAVEIPGYTFLLFTLNRWGRKSILCGCMLVSGSALLATLLVPSEFPWLVVVLAMIGKLAITASYGAIYVFSAEQFPTVIRNVGLGASSMCARAGGMIAPFVNLLADFWNPLPLVIFGALTLGGGLLTLLLPETLNRKLPDTIADGERFGKKLEVSAGDLEKQMVPMLSANGHEKPNGAIASSEKDA